MLGIQKGFKVEDFYRQPHDVKSFEDLYSVYVLFEEQRKQRSMETLGALGGNNLPNLEPDEFVDWLVKRGICPHALIIPNSRYHFENIVLLDSEMGLRMPDPKLSIGEVPVLFFQALNIVRGERAKLKQEEKSA